MGREAKTPGEIVEYLLYNGIYYPDGCIVSHLRPNAKGYIPIQVGGRAGIKWRAHRLVYTVKIRAVGPDYMVLHTCDNRACINPQHLFLGTAQDNTDDMIAKGRECLVHPKVSHYHDKIIELYKQGRDRFEIANILFLTPHTVWNHISPKGANYVRSDFE